MPKYSSNMMHPTDHTSHGCDQPSSATTERRDESMSHANSRGKYSTWTAEEPPLTQYDFGGSVVPRGDDCAVVFVVESGASEVDEPNVRPLHSSHVTFLQSGGRFSVKWKRKTTKKDFSTNKWTINVI